MPTITTQAAISAYQLILDERGEASCGKAADYLNVMGFTSLRGKKVSRMAVWRAMQSTSQGLLLLRDTKKRIKRI